MDFNNHIYHKAIFPKAKFIQSTEGTGVAVCSYADCAFVIYAYENYAGSELMKGYCFASEAKCLIQLYHALNLVWDTEIGLFF